MQLDQLPTLDKTSRDRFSASSELCSKNNNASKSKKFSKPSQTLPEPRAKTPPKTIQHHARLSVVMDDIKLFKVNVVDLNAVNSNFIPQQRCIARHRYNNAGFSLRINAMMLSCVYSAAALLQDK